MPQRRYELSVWPTDKTPGWKLGSRVVPQGYTIRVERYVHVAYQPGSPEHLDLELQLTEDQVEAMREGSPSAAGWVLVPRPWLELEVESSPTVPPRCVALRAADGISTPELRFPLAGVVTEATAAIASRDGTFTDPPHGLVYEDMLFEASRARGRRKRTRHKITPERLDEVARIVEENPRKTTEAVRRHFGFTRGYSRKLIKLAEERDP